jgi:hypothetical protein
VRTSDHEILHGIGKEIPLFTGFVMTTPKENPLVEIPLLSPKPAGQKNALLASWQYGVGRSVAFTTDAGQRWTKDWPQWPGYEPLFTQMVRWAMRPTDERETLRVFTEHRDGQVHVTVTALDKNDAFLNFLELSGNVLGPQAQPQELALRQIAPGRYAGQFPALQAGSYFLSIGSGPGRPQTRAGMNVPYSAEFRLQEPNQALLRSLAALKPVEGESGEVIADPATPALLAESLKCNVFRRDLQRATSRQDYWPTLVFAASCLLVLDVFNRRVLVSFGWVSMLAAELARRFGRGAAERPTGAASLARLQQRKSELEGEFDSRRAAARFEPTLDDARLPAHQRDLVAGGTAAAVANPSAIDIAPQAEEDHYTARLLKAKQRVRSGRRTHDTPLPPERAP